jgi:hypothetical protein
VGRQEHREARQPPSGRQPICKYDDDYEEEIRGTGGVHMCIISHCGTGLPAWGLVPWINGFDQDERRNGMAAGQHKQPT